MDMDLKHRQIDMNCKVIPKPTCFLVVCSRVRSGFHLTKYFTRYAVVKSINNLILNAICFRGQVCFLFLTFCP